MSHHNTNLFYHSVVTINS